jgi:hypothetical protein
VAAIAEAFHVLPSVVERDLYDDPEQLSLECLSFLRYAEAKAAFDRSKDSKDLDAWSKSSVMEEVKANALGLAHDRTHPNADVNGCAGCAKARARKAE